MVPIKMTKRAYKKPELSRISLDNTISLVMMSAPGQPGTDPPTSRTPGNSKDEPFASPFNNKPFG